MIVPLSFRVERWLLAGLVALSFGCSQVFASTETGSVTDADLGWRFHLGDLPGAESPTFNDSSWRVVDLPHDWSIEPPSGSDPDSGPHDRATPEGQSVGYLRGGIGWYRLHLPAEPVEPGKELELIFDGAQQECDVWVNGQHVAFQPHGYIPFQVEMARYVKPSVENVVAVRVLNPEANTRWYAGSGLYREVKIRSHLPVYIPTWGLHVETAWLSETKARLQIHEQVKNDTASPEDISLELELTSPSGERTVYSLGTLRIEAGTTEDVNQTVEVDSPASWSPEKPQLYRAEAKLLKNKIVLDTALTRFGIRTLTLDAKEGLRINGKPLKLLGACLHHDNGLLGAAAFPDAERRRVRLMKANGFNAIRTSHNPPSAAFLDACDDEGILVIDEFADTWEFPKKTNGYQRYFTQHWEHDLRAMIARDFNHPSVIVWSIGNEIAERFDPRGVEIGGQLAKAVRSLDPRRPVAAAVNEIWETPNQSRWEDNDPAFSVLDLGGYNYAWKHYESDHARFPERIMAGTESFPREALENWLAVEAHPYVIGDFVWTGMDHIGESGIGHTRYFDVNADPKTVGQNAWQLMPWPFWVNWAGDIDLIGNKKPQSYYRDVVWKRSLLEIAVHEPIPLDKQEKVSSWGWPAETMSWNWPAAKGKSLEVSVYSRAEKVRLELNGRMIGEKTIDASRSITATFSVPWEAGVLSAKAIHDGQVVAEKTLSTTGDVASIRVFADGIQPHAARDALIYLPIELLDSRGDIVPDAAIALTATVTGEAELKAFGSANPEDIQSFIDSAATTFRGHALLILRSTGRAGTANVEIRAANLPVVTKTITFR